jgi:hypothetical protein
MMVSEIFLMELMRNCLLISFVKNGQYRQHTSVTGIGWKTLSGSEGVWKTKYRIGE